jgi:hypothetical protein
MTILDDRESAGQPVEEAGTAAGVRALFEEARQRRRLRHRIFGLGLAAVLLIAALMVFVFLAGRKPTAPPASDGGAPAAGRPIPPAPTQMVVWSQTSPGTLSIQVISSKTGHVLRTLAIDGSAPPNPCPLPREQIASVPLGGGAISVVAQGHDPAVSPNGRLLAYQTFTDVTDAPEAIVVQNLTTGASTTWQFATNAPDISSGLSWSPDSKSLAFQSETVIKGVFHLRTHVIDLSSPNRSLDDTALIALPLCPAPTPWASPGAGRDMLWVGFLSATAGIGTCHHAGLTRQTDWNQPIVVNLATGRMIEALPVIRGLEGGGFSSFQVDPSGHHLLFVGAGSGAGGLYRWTVIGHPPRAVGAPSLVKNAVGSATWVPSQP